MTRCPAELELLLYFVSHVREREGSGTSKGIMKHVSACPDCRKTLIGFGTTLDAENRLKEMNRKWR